MAPPDRLHLHLAAVTGPPDYRGCIPYCSLPAARPFIPRRITRPTNNNRSPAILKISINPENPDSDNDHPKNLGCTHYQCTLSACILYDNFACSHTSFIPVFELCAWGRGEHLYYCPRSNTEGHGELLFCPRRNADGRGGHQGRMGLSLRSCAALRCSAPICARISLLRQTSTSPNWYSSSHPSFQRSNGLEHSSNYRRRSSLRRSMTERAFRICTTDVVEFRRS